MGEYLVSFRKRFIIGAKALHSKRQEWEKFENMAVSLLKSYEIDSRKNQYYESLYVLTDKEIDGRQTIGQSFIQFYAGSHHTGISETIHDREKKTTQWKGMTEKSGCLSIVQEPKGGIVFLVYPSESDSLKWKDEYIVYKFFARPSLIEWKDVRDAADFYLRFAFYTSIYGTPTIMESIELWWIQFRVKSIFWKLYKSLFTIARIAIAAKTGAPVK